MSATSPSCKPGGGLGLREQEVGRGSFKKKPGRKPHTPAGFTGAPFAVRGRPSLRQGPGACTRVAHLSPRAMPGLVRPSHASEERGVPGPQEMSEAGALRILSPSKTAQQPPRLGGGGPAGLVRVSSGLYTLPTMKRREKKAGFEVRG